jgi:hypothetical protein
MALDSSVAARLKYSYSRLGFEYYLSGRFAFLASKLPMTVTGNLFHHAVEMFLKGYLSTKFDEKERKNFHHHLRRIWLKFKEEAGDPQLHRFDGVIAELDKFENIRYPERPLKSGMAIMFSLTGNPSQNFNETVPQYNLNLEKIDELVADIFQKCLINPKSFTSVLREPGITFLKQENKKAPVWE